MSALIGCPKCGYESENAAVCERCGASFEKMRERELRAIDETAGAEAGGNVYGAPAAAVSGITGRWSPLMIGALVASLAMVAGVASLVKGSRTRSEQVAGASVAQLSTDDFDTKVAAAPADEVWVVDFWAPWCAPCRKFGPEFEAASADMPGNVKFAKVNVDEERPIAERYSIRSIPSVVVFKSGSEVGRPSAAGREKFAESVKKLL